MSRRKQKFPLHLKNDQLDVEEKEEQEQEEEEEEEGMEEEEEEGRLGGGGGRDQEPTLNPIPTPITGVPTQRANTLPPLQPHPHPPYQPQPYTSAKIEVSGVKVRGSTTSITPITTITTSAIDLNRSANMIQGQEKDVKEEEEEEEEEGRRSAIGREEEEEEEEEEEVKKRRVIAVSYQCPVCNESFKSKRAFNSHILVHCQLVNGALVGGKRGAPDPHHHHPHPFAPPNRKRAREENGDDKTRRSRKGEEEEEEEEEAIEEEEEEEEIEQYTIKQELQEEEEENGDDIENGLPLDLSCRGGGGGNHNNQTGEIDRERPVLPSPLYRTQTQKDRTIPVANQNTATVNFQHYHGYQPSQCFTLHPGLPTLPNYHPHLDRGPLEDENDNLVNEAREREKAFIDSSQNEQYLTEDSSGFDPPPPLPLYGSGGGAVRRVRVGGDDGPPMVYTVRLHAEQVLVSRILGINEETGDKMELYKCYMCGVAFPSVSRLQAHLYTHKQQFVCSKCNYSCDSRVVFSSHVQREHLSTTTTTTATATTAAATTGGGGGGRGVCVNGGLERTGDTSEDTSSAENTVTVAALLSALREKARGGTGAGAETGAGRGSSPAPDEEEEIVSSGEDGDRSHGDAFKFYTCRFCGKKFDRAFSCNRHERVHTGYKPCFCRVCGRGFSEPRNLRHHVIRFHSDGSLRHLIKRDRRRKGENENGPASPLSPHASPPALRHASHPPHAPHAPPHAPPETRLKDVLKETANKLISSSNIDLSGLSSKTTGLEITLTTKPQGTQATRGGRASPVSPSSPPSPTRSPSLPPVQVMAGSGDATTTTTTTPAAAAAAAAVAAAAVTTYTTSLTKIIAASLDNSSRGGVVRRLSPLGAEERLGTLKGAELEPGEIRLDGRARIIDDGEAGRRLVVEEEEEEEGLDHSPHFSNYAPRLNIVQEPIDRDKALAPITDDIGRTFYECPYCHKLFGSTSDMNRHLDFHEDIRPYNCEYCDYSARTNSQLKVHKMRHEGIKLYSCEVCNYNGVTQSDLNRHKKTQSHIARSQNICTICGLGFYTASQKQVHIIQCHPEVEGASSLIQMSLGPPVAPLIPATITTTVPTTTTTTDDGGGGGGGGVGKVVLIS